MDRASLLRLVDAAGLPPAVRDCLRAAACSRAGSPVKRALRRSPAAFLGGLKALLKDAASAIGSPEDDVLFVTGFEAANRAPERLGAALAELAALRWLAGRGFTGLRLLERRRGKTADLAGRLGGREYFFEVCCVGEDAFSGAGAAAFAGLKYDRKRPQVAAEMKRAGQAGGGLVLVAGLPGPGIPAGDAALSELAGLALEGRRGGLHLCLLDGDRAGVWPPLGR